MRKTILLLPLTAAFAVPLLSSIPATAQSGASNIAKASAETRPGTVARGGKGVLVVTLSVKPTYHVNANQPNDSAYIPTVFTPQPMAGIVFGPAHYPAAKLVKVSYSSKPLLVYRGQVTVTVPFTVAKSVKPGPLTLRGTVAYQGCDDKSCFPPASTDVKATMLVH